MATDLLTAELNINLFKASQTDFISQTIITPETAHDLTYVTIIYKIYIHFLQKAHSTQLKIL